MPSASRTVTATVGRPRESRISSADRSAALTAEISHFFDIYKELEPGKGTDVRGWQDHAAAEEVIEAALTRRVSGDLTGA